MQNEMGQVDESQCFSGWSIFKNFRSKERNVSNKRDTLYFRKNKEVGLVDLQRVVPAGKDEYWEHGVLSSKEGSARLALQFGGVWFVDVLLHLGGGGVRRRGLLEIDNDSNRYSRYAKAKNYFLFKYYDTCTCK